MTDRPHPTGKITMPYSYMELSNGDSILAVPLARAMRLFDMLDWQVVIDHVRMATVDGVDWVALQDVIDHTKESK